MRYHHVILILLVIITLTVFWPVIGHDFLYLDDDILIYENPHLHPTSFGKILYFWHSPYQNLYIPLTYSVWSLLSAWSGWEIFGVGLNPKIFHLVNLVFHVASVLVVFAILRLIFLRNKIGDVIGPVSDSRRIDRAAGIGALLFALHPLQVESFVWASSTKDVLSGLLSLTAIRQYLIYAVGRPGPETAPRRLHYLLGTAGFLLALFAKPSAVVVPVLAGLIGWGLLRHPGKQVVRELGVWLILSVPIMVMAWLAERGLPVEVEVPIPARFLIAGDALSFYFRKLLIPVGLVPDYGRSVKELLISGPALTGCLPAAGLAVLAWFGRRRIWAVAFWIFAAGLLPVLGFVPHAFQNISTVADRYLYLSMLGPALALSVMCLPGRRKIINLLGVSVVIMLGMLGLRQSRFWAGNLPLCRHILTVNPKSWLAHNNLGYALYTEGKLDEAADHFYTALDLEPRNPRAHNNLGNILVSQGKAEEAVSHYSLARKISPDDPVTHNNLGVALAELGETRAAGAEYREALRLRPDYPEAHNNLGNLLSREGRYDRAVAHFQEALRLQPGAARFHNNLALILIKLGRVDEAIARSRAALRLQPDYAQAYNNLALAYSMKGEYTEAIENYRQSLRYDPEVPSTYFNLGLTLLKDGKTEAARRAFISALKLDPHLEEAIEALRKIDERDERAPSGD